MTSFIWMCGDLLLSVGKVALILIAVFWALQRLHGGPVITPEPSAGALPSTKKHALPTTQTRDPLPRRNRLP